MIAVDSNILVYAHRGESAFHAVAKRRLTELAEGNALWAIPWPCVHEFFSVVTHPRIFVPPTALAGAFEQVEVWLGAPNLLLLAEAEGYWPHLRSIIATGKIIGPRIHDAHIAALCRQHGVRELWSADRDFSRFPDLKVVNPLTA